MNSAFPFQVLLCFSNGNHYDIVYPIKYKESSAVCQCKYHSRVGLDIFFLSFVVLSRYTVLLHKHTFLTTLGYQKS